MSRADAPADVAIAYLDALSGDDPAAVAALVADDFHNEHLSALGATSSGRAEYRRRLPGFMEMFAGRSYRVDDLVEESRDGTAAVVVRYRLTARCDGGDIDIPGVMWLQIRDGAITDRIDCWDSLTFLRQTGAAPVD